MWDDGIDGLRGFGKREGELGNERRWFVELS